MVFNIGKRRWRCIESCISSFFNIDFWSIYIQFSNYRENAFFSEKRENHKSEHFSRKMLENCIKGSTRILIYLSQPFAVYSSSISGLNVRLIIETSLKTSYKIDLFLKRSIENLIKSRSENSIICDSMHLHLLFPMVKTATFYQKLFKKYSFIFLMSVSITVRHTNKTALIGICYYNFSWTMIKYHRKIEHSFLYQTILTESFLKLFIKNYSILSLLLVCPKYFKSSWFG